VLYSIRFWASKLWAGSGAELFRINKVEFILKLPNVTQGT
jgi:hypothetical protein